MSVNVLVCYPGMGRLWLSKAEWSADHVEGEAWDDSGVGDYNMPDDYRGEPIWMNFPLSCVLKVEPDRPIQLRKLESVA